MYMLQSKVRDYDLIYKVLVIGESFVGKTALVRKYKNPGKALPRLLTTIGIDYQLVELVIDGLRVRAQFWDTVGQERYRTMTRNFFGGAKGVLLLFDITNRESFILVENWMNELKSFDLDKAEIFMVGNKIDLEDRREVSYEEGKMVASGLGMKYFETSAKTGENVTKTIEQLIYNMKDANHPFLNANTNSRSNSNTFEELFSEDKEIVKVEHITHKQADRCC